MTENVNEMSIGIAFVLSLLLLASLALPVHGQSASIVLKPDEGVSAITIEGSGFNANSPITVYWDDEWIPTVPLQVSTDGIGAFTCIISTYNQTGVGPHEVKAVDTEGNAAIAIFTVTDVKGPQGEQGPPGPQGEQGPPGPVGEGVLPGYLAGGLLAAAAIGALTGGLLGRGRKEETEETSEGVEPQ